MNYAKSQGCIWIIEPTPESPGYVCWINEPIPESLQQEEEELPMKAFHGIRDAQDRCHLYLRAGETLTKISPDRSLEVYNHSPDGFEWGYGGSGPSQLSLAILLEALSDDFEQGDAPGETPDSVALHLYQDFKWQVVSGLPESQWTLPMDTIKQWIVENTNATHAREKIYQC